MRDPHRWIQTAALVVLAAAAIPLLVNEASTWSERGALRDRARAHARLAESALEAGDPGLAGQALADALEARPADELLRRRLVAVHAEQILRDPATVSAANALRLQSELTAELAREQRPRLRVALGKVLQLRGLNDDARRAFEHAVEADPKLALAHMHLGDHLLKLGQHDAAATALGRALELDPALHEARFALGQVRLAQEKWSEAETLLAEAAAKLDHGYVHLALGRARLRQDKTEEALEPLGRAVSRSPDVAAAHALLGEARARSGQLEPALLAYEAALRLAGDADVARRRADVLQAMGRHQEAGAAYGELRQALPDDPRPLVGMARSAIALGQGDSARRALEVAIRLAERDPAHAAALAEARGQLASLPRPAAPADAR